MKHIIIVLLFSLPAFGDRPHPLQPDGSYDFTGWSQPEIKAWLTEDGKKQQELYAWSQREMIRIIVRYPELIPLHDNYPYRFMHLLRVLKEQGKTIEDVIVIEGGRQYLNEPGQKIFLGDRI